LAVLALVVFAAALCMPRSAAAQVAEPAPAAPSAPPAPKAQHTVVVVADVLADETQNARLRAQAYETARRYGLESLPGADAMEAARGIDALEGGKVTADRALLERLRVTLGATVLVRVSQDSERDGKLVVRVTAVREGGGESQVVEAPSADLGTAVASLVDRVLATLMGTTPKGAAPPVTPKQPGEDSAPPPVILLTPGVTREQQGPSAVAAGKAWSARGGVRVSYEVRALGTLLYQPEVVVTGTNPATGASDRDTTEQFGIGGGVGVRASIMFLSLPDPAMSSGSTWFAFRLGAGLDGSVLYTRPPDGFHYTGVNAEQREINRDDQVWFYPTGSLQLGLHLAIGELLSPTIWRGVVLGVAYSPAVIWSLQIGESSFDTEFNHAGFELTLDIASLEARSGITHEPQIRLFAFVLPRIRDELPWLASLGIGAAWY